mgnify:CR=1 FL=1
MEIFLKILIKNKKVFKNLLTLQIVSDIINKLSLRDTATTKTDSKESNEYVNLDK